MNDKEIKDMKTLLGTTMLAKDRAQKEAKHLSRENIALLCELNELKEQYIKQQYTIKTVS